MDEHLDVPVGSDIVQSIVDATKNLTILEGMLDELEMQYGASKVYGKGPLDDWFRRMLQFLDLLFEMVDEFTDERCRVLEDIVRRAAIIADYELEFDESDTRIIDSVRKIRIMAHLAFAMFHYNVNENDNTIRVCKVVYSLIDEETVDKQVLYPLKLMNGCALASMKRYHDAKAELEVLANNEEHLSEDMVKKYLLAYAVSLHFVKLYQNATEQYCRYISLFKDEQPDSDQVQIFINDAMAESQTCFLNSSFQF